MLWQKSTTFSYDDYEELLKRGDYAHAQEYCERFPDNENAHNALYHLGRLLFEQHSETEGIKVLKSVAAITENGKKKRGKLINPEENARFYLEQYYFRKWKDSQQLEDLKQTADCLGHGWFCQHYAALLYEEVGDSEEVDSYKYLYAMDYCVRKMDEGTYRLKHLEKHLDKLESVLREDIGLIATDMTKIQEHLDRIESHQEIMIQMIKKLPEETRNALQQDFSAFRAQMVKLSEQMADREDAVCELIEKAQSIDLNLQAGQNALLELKSLAEQISAADQDREDRLVQSVDGLKKAILDNNNLLLQEIVDEAKAEIDVRFQDRLSKDARDSIVTALFTLNFYRELNKEHEPLVEYSGVVILAATALEMELYNRLYSHFEKFVKENYGEKNFNSWYNKFTLGSFGYVVGIWSENNWDQEKRKKIQAQKEQRFRMFLKDPKYRGLFSTDPDSRSMFQYESGNTLKREPLEKFAKRLGEFNQTRRNAAHKNSVTLKAAETACQLAFLSPQLSPQERASQKLEESMSLLEKLLDSCKEVQKNG